MRGKEKEMVEGLGRLIVLAVGLQGPCTTWWGKKISSIKI